MVIPADCLGDVQTRACTGENHADRLHGRDTYLSRFCSSRWKIAGLQRLIVRCKTSGASLGLVLLTVIVTDEGEKTAVLLPGMGRGSTWNAGAERGNRDSRAVTDSDAGHHWTRSLGCISWTARNGQGSTITTKRYSQRSKIPTEQDLASIGSVVGMQVFRASRANKPRFCPRREYGNDCKQDRLCGLTIQIASILPFKPRVLTAELQDIEQIKMVRVPPSLG